MMSYDGVSGHSLPFANIHWKSSLSQCGHPFPDLNVKRVKEIVSSGGRLAVDVSAGGKHLAPKEFHKVLSEAQSGDDLVILDVRNRWEYEVGHFTDAAGRRAIHPNMRNYSQFTSYIDDNEQLFEDKTVLMYCTGGIRCETASAYLVSKGICKSVNQLAGGIHTYCEEFSSSPAAAVDIPASSEDVKGSQDSDPSSASDAASSPSHENSCADVVYKGNSSDCRKVSMGKHFYHGQNVVFDRRSQLQGGSGVITGKCSECEGPFDELRPECLCTVCVCPVLVCTRCRQGVASGMEKSSNVGGAAELADAGSAGTNQQSACVPVPRRTEWYCSEHGYLRGIFFEFIDVFSLSELKRQFAALKVVLAQIDARISAGEIPRQKDPRQRRRTVTKQMRRLEKRMSSLRSGAAAVRGPDLPARCRSCKRDSCEGACWGFWKAPKALEKSKSRSSSRTELAA
jgi:predicted sulfurtransferase